MPHTIQRLVSLSETAKYLCVTRHHQLGPTSCRTRAALFRVVYPYNNQGNDVFHVTDDVCFQADDATCSQWLWLTGFKNRTILVSSAVAPLVFNLHDVAAPPLNEVSEIHQSLVVRGLVYNIWCLPRVATSLLHLSPYKADRTSALLPADVDFVVFCEAFDDHAKQILTSEMKRHGFIYETSTASGKAKLKLFNLGVFLMSKFPLVGCDTLLYGSVVIADENMVDKAAVYVQMLKHGQVVHIFATHKLTQAWAHKAAMICRAKHIKLLAAWIHSKELPPDEAVLVAGGFNIDQFGKPSTEFDWMAATLQVETPPTVPESPHFSFDPVTNVLASPGMRRKSKG
ncbi:hypothetical protein DYB37_003216 [Aphanomyces astaci]|uniref:Endonuclease/exonuclease/phosphatase domain-containing protein n=1 Tax=Aphanomyces astaci TaxID=112090 RepID=A0A3R7BD86_APHAT|nr:hypothetical protein DYB35_008280 [Aphanomyces astaci]RHZ25457.1 hypothetical protein DYB37_003216 [Aphanomyces astaci]